jgi:hypothetical protein
MDDDNERVKLENDVHRAVAARGRNHTNFVEVKQAGGSYGRHSAAQLHHWTRSTADFHLTFDSNKCVVYSRDGTLIILSLYLNCPLVVSKLQADI